METEEREPGTGAFYQKYIQPDKNVLDIGAWEGATPLLAYAYNAKHIYAVEADPINIHRAKMNIRENHADDRITLINRAIYKKTDQIMFFGTPLLHGSSTKSFSKENEGFKVLSTSIKDLIKDNEIENLSIVKIDIEGAERFLVEDLIYLSNLPNLAISLSLHPIFWGSETESILKGMKEAFDLYDSYEYETEEKINFERILEYSKSKRNHVGALAFEIILKTKS